MLETTGGSVGGASSVTTTYTKRGTVGTVGSSYGDLVTQVKRDADGMVQEIVYGDEAATTTGFMYDELRRLRNLTTYRGKPQLWPQTGTHTQQLLLQDEQYTYDRVGHPTEIRDWRIASEWDPGAKPVTRKLKYDDLYRLSRIEYQYPQGSDDWKDPFAAEVSDINRPQPSPRADFTGAKRPLWQTYAYDWLGNTVSTDDDAHAFYDRSLGTVENDGYRLAGADNATKGGTRTGYLTSDYDASGNLIAMDLHRQGPCVPANKCTNQHFEYEWDEVGRLVRARRFDMANPPSGTPPDAELSYTYDASDNRVLKTVGDHYTAYIFGSLELRSTTFDGDYVVGPETETVYLQAHGVRLARVVHEVDDPYELASTHVFLELGDQLGSTSVVLDLATGELVERSTAYAYGATESDYRPERWGKFREDYRFTGKEEDIEVGLQYFGKRFYAPLLQRWVSADPLAVHAPGQADLNLYAYVHGRVLVAVNPVGLEPPKGKVDYSPGTSAPIYDNMAYMARESLNGQNDPLTRAALGLGAIANGPAAAMEACGNGLLHGGIVGGQLAGRASQQDNVADAALDTAEAFVYLAFGFVSGASGLMPLVEYGPKTPVKIEGRTAPAPAPTETPSPAPKAPAPKVETAAPGPVKVTLSVADGVEAVDAQPASSAPQQLTWVEGTSNHALDRHSPHRPPGADGKGTLLPASWSEQEFLDAVQQKINDPSTPRTPVPAARGGVGSTALQPITINGETRRILSVAEVPDPAIPGSGPGVITSAYPRHPKK